MAQKIIASIYIELLSFGMFIVPQCYFFTYGIFY